MGLGLPPLASPPHSLEKLIVTPPLFGSSADSCKVEKFAGFACRWSMATVSSLAPKGTNSASAANIRCPTSEAQLGDNYMYSALDDVRL